MSANTHDAHTDDTQEVPGAKRAPLSPIDKHAGGTMFREEEVKRGMREPLESESHQETIQPQKKGEKGAPFNEQDPKRRLGTFTGAGEHARKGSRTAGIVGQKKSKHKTDRRS
jgi:hypothetical protein